MLAKIVPILECLRDSTVVRVQSYSVIRHASNGFEQGGVVCGEKNIFAPGKGSVPCDKNSGDGEGIEILESAGDGEAGVEYVAAIDFLVCEVGGDGNFAVEIVRVRGAERWNGHASLRPCSCEVGMGVSDAANGREFPVKEQVGGEIRGRFERTFDDFACEVSDDHVLGAEFLVGDAAWLDGDKILIAVDAAGVAEGEEDEALPDEVEIGFKNLLFEMLEHAVRFLAE